MNKAIQLNPDKAYTYNNSFWVHNLRGWEKTKEGNYNEAILYYDKAIQLKPDDADAYYDRGAVKRKLEKYAEAIADYDKYIQLKPDDAYVYYYRGLAKYDLGKYAEAIADFQKAIELNPGFSRELNEIIAQIKEEKLGISINAAPLGFILGEATLNQVMAKDQAMKMEGYSSWTGGKLYKSSGSVHGVDGLKEITYIFDANDKLDAVTMTMNKNYFDATHAALRSKYTVTYQEIPFVGDKYVTYTKGHSIIELNAPHLSFDMEVVYKTKAFDTAFKTKSAEAEKEKKQQQRSKF